MRTTTTTQLPRFNTGNDAAEPRILQLLDTLFRFSLYLLHANNPVFLPHYYTFHGFTALMRHDPSKTIEISGHLLSNKQNKL